MKRNIQKILTIILLLFLAAFSHFSCSVDRGNGTSAFHWNGRWITKNDPHVRGTFSADFEQKDEELSGAISIPGLGINSAPLVGEVDQTYDSYHNEITYIDFRDENNTISFSCIVFSWDIEDDTMVQGDFTNNQTGEEGLWYSLYPGIKEFETMSSIPIPITIEEPTGLCFDGSHLWICDNKEDRIHEIDPSDGQILFSFDAPGSGTGHEPTGLAWGDSHLWISDNSTRTIYKCDTNGEVESSFEVDIFIASDIQDLAYENGTLWLADDMWNKIVNVESDGTLIKSFKAPYCGPLGMTFDGTYLWNADAHGSEYWPFLFKMETSGKIVDQYYSPYYIPRGLAFDAPYLWCIDKWVKRIFKMQIY